MKGRIELEPSLGALLGSEGVSFRVWAPTTEEVTLLLEEQDRTVPLEPEGNGFHSVVVPGLVAGTRYRYRLDGGGSFPDPASRYQPDGVHGPSEVVDPNGYRWLNSPPTTDGEPVIYELHVGTMTSKGDFAGVAEKLGTLRELGVTCLELMPVADFPGRWNWGYDPGAFFAPSRAYGSPDDLRALVDEAHGLGLRVLLDVVYNHFGPDGAYHPAFAPHTFSSRHRTPWGQALDFDGPHSAGLRRYFIENALMWLREYRFDGLRLDATFAIVDDSPVHLLTELVDAVRALPGPPKLLIAEDPRNLRNLVLERERGGLGLDGVWADDFHHQVRVRLAGDDRGYYRDFSGSSHQLARTITGNWFYSGHHSRNGSAPRGTPAHDLPARSFVYCIQNHDQVGNRPRGSRLNHEVPLHSYLAASALLLFLPQTPLLFMGQEWAATAPFLFFTDHGGDLGVAVSEGRRQEFSEFDFDVDVPDPQEPQTFRASILDWDELEREPHAGVWRLYRDLLRLRRSLGGEVSVEAVQEGGLALRRGAYLLLVAFDEGPRFDLPAGARLAWSSEESSYAQTPHPPDLTESAVEFARSGALIFEGGAMNSSSPHNESDPEASR